MTALVAEKLHAELGASTAARWMACPGSIALSRDVPHRSADSSPYAQEGTLAHTLAEVALSNSLSAEGARHKFGLAADEDMAAHVQVYLDVCRALFPSAGAFWIERRFTLEVLNPPVPMFGTADFVAYDQDTHTLTVVDLKYGQGVVVEAKGNKQLRYYALGAALSIGSLPIDKVVMTIVQPRAQHADGPIRSDEMTYAELMQFSAELMIAAQATTQPDAPLHAGSHCRFCPASGACPQQQQFALTVAQNEFAAVDDWRPPAPELLPIEQIVEMMQKFHILEDWMSACRQLVTRKLEAGEDVPGMKLVAKRPTRKFTDEQSVVTTLTGLNVSKEQAYDFSLKSPAQIEKIVGKKLFADFIAPFVSKESSGYKLVPASDPAPAISLSAGDEFAALMPGIE